ncbi:MAG: hydrogenase formation protein HypD [Candidatus Aenigmarchaeota archaeon]|nr:hydrogenase formation protein HypD [Candidatus Aenigmarchaeota archaeon]
MKVKAVTGKIIKEIASISKTLKRPVKIMEVCGTHTQTIAKYSIRSILPENITLVSGPGCPVCVTPQKTIDKAVRLAIKGIPIATYGDMLKVPGTVMSLEKARANGADIFIVESTTDALKLKEQHKDLVFLAIGFETTTPMTAYAVKKGLDIICAHKTIPEAMQAIISDKNNQIDGFINPGHVSIIIGTKAYLKIDTPQVIAGFEPEDVLAAILMLLHQIKDNKKKVENEYTKAVRPEGNIEAKQLTENVFEKCDAQWRGIGTIPKSGLKLKDRYKAQDAIQKYADILKDLPEPKNNKECRCADVMLGKINPQQCPMFAKGCDIENPIGPCMVGSEGACMIAYRYRDKI